MLGKFNFFQSPLHNVTVRTTNEEVERYVGSEVEKEDEKHKVNITTSETC